MSERNASALRTLPDGCLIVIEGIDGAGKTTQCERLVERLRAEGWAVERTREPTDGVYGRKIRENAVSGEKRLSLDEELDLFIQDRREHVRECIKPALSRGAIVVMDRYYYSTMAYQGARGADPQEIRRANEAFAPSADLLLYLRIEVDAAGDRIDRGRTGRDLFEAAEYLRQVARHFDAMEDAQMVRINAALPPDKVFDAVWKVVSQHLENALVGGNAS